MLPDPNALLKLLSVIGLALTYIGAAAIAGFDLAIGRTVPMPVLTFVASGILMMVGITGLHIGAMMSLTKPPIS